jgi:hypothetical protein
MLLFAPASASAGPNFASVTERPAVYGGHTYKYLIVDVEPSMGDNTPRAVSVRYEEGAFVFTDPRGMLPQPGISPGFPEGNSCVQAGPDAVRCPADLSDPAIYATSFEVSTGWGDDRIDLRDVPDLPGIVLPESPDAAPVPARPSFLARVGDDIVLTGAYGASGDLGAGADRLVGGPGGDGAAGAGAISGGRGPDRLIGGPGDDFLVGALGNDFLKGDAGHDNLVGGLGNDRLHSRDGQVDFVSCGPGRRSRQPIRRDRIDKRVRHEGKLTHYGCTSKD